MLSSSDSVIESYISLDAPRSEDGGVSPRFADRAAPAAFCWALDFAGMSTSCGIQERAKLRVVPQLLERFTFAGVKGVSKPLDRCNHARNFALADRHSDSNYHPAFSVYLDNRPGRAIAAVKFCDSRKPRFVFYRENFITPGNDSAII